MVAALTSALHVEALKSISSISRNNIKSEQERDMFIICIILYLKTIFFLFLNNRLSLKIVLEREMCDFT